MNRLLLMSCLLGLACTEEPGVAPGLEGPLPDAAFADGAANPSDSSTPMDTADTAAPVVCMGPDGPVPPGAVIDGCQICGETGGPVACPSLCTSEQCVRVTRLHTGGEHNCVSFADGLPWCWGAPE